MDLDCGDNSCRFAKNRGGMRTNGGCRCFENAGFGPSAVGAALQMLPEITRLRAEVEKMTEELKTAEGVAYDLSLENAKLRRVRNAAAEYLAADEAFGVTYGDDRDRRNHDRCITAEGELRAALDAANTNLVPTRTKLVDPALDPDEVRRAVEHCRRYYEHGCAEGTLLAAAEAWLREHT